jgi:succinylglutamic semialdehyde dehydrogenase
VAAFPAWARLPLAERVAIVEKFAALLEENKKHLAEVISSLGT